MQAGHSRLGFLVVNVSFQLCHYYYKSSGVSDVCKPCQMSASSLRLVNKGPSDKKEDIVGAFSRRSMTLLDDGLGVMLISIP